METIEFWVCLDCALAHCNGETTESPDREPWAELDPGQHVTLNDQCQDCHADNVECHHYGSRFSWNDCDGCGSTLGGDRFRFALWLTA